MKNVSKKIVGYSDQISIQPLEKINFMVSCESQIKIIYSKIVKLIHGDCNPSGPGYKDEQVKSYGKKKHKARHQRINSGSCILIPIVKKINLSKDFSFTSFIFPTLDNKNNQSIIASNYLSKENFNLFINDKFSLQLNINKKNVLKLRSNFRLKHWYLIGFTYSARNHEVKLFQYPVKHENCEPEIKKKKLNIKSFAFEQCISFASSIISYKNDLVTSSNCYNGKIDSPKFLDTNLSEIFLSVISKHPNKPMKEKNILSSWDFSKYISTEKIIDTGNLKLNGFTYNFPARAMKGVNWDGTEFNWKLKSSHYSSIHFHDDDIYDAKWKKSFHWKVPSNIKSGLYCAHIFDGKNNEDYIPFVVRPSKKNYKNKIVFLLPTASYMAYANDHNAVNGYKFEMLMGRLTVLQPEDLFVDQHREYGLSMYDTHSDGSGVCYSSRLRPILNMRPKYSSSNGGVGSGLWQFNADTHIIDWLEENNFQYDVITDEDLEKQGVNLLKNYKVLITSSHPEYHSTNVWDTVYQFQQLGGNMMYLGGNGWYWRIVWHPKLEGIIEVRRAEGGVRSWEAESGEYYHSFNGEYGGMWRRLGRPPNILLGIGFSAQGFDISSYYRRTKQSYSKEVAFIFDGVKDDIIGNFGLVGGGAAGLELDRYDRSLGSPPDAYVLATSENHSDLYLGVTEEIGVNMPNLSGSQNQLVKADIVYFQRKSGAKIFSTGSISWAGSLSHNHYNNNISKITYNILNNFISAYKKNENNKENQI
jgi:N,N-dimethylformamidase